MATHQHIQRKTDSELVMELRDCSFYYGALRAVAKVSLPVVKNRITALIGPSGCGKSHGPARHQPHAGFDAGRRASKARLSIAGRTSTPTRSTRSRCGGASAWSFKSRTPSPRAYSTMSPMVRRLLGIRKKAALDEIVERSLVGASLWDEVKEDLNRSGLALSGGQQQRLCIARAIAVEPDVILMDEPCSALDPIATQHIEELMLELQREYTIVIVTHNMQQAQRASDFTAFFNIRKAEEKGHEVRWGRAGRVQQHGGGLRAPGAARDGRLYRRALWVGQAQDQWARLSESPASINHMRAVFSSPCRPRWLAGARACLVPAEYAPVDSRLRFLIQ